MTEDFATLCKRLEHFETPEWAARAILTKEILTDWLIDPCAGAGVLSNAAKKAGYQVVSSDIHEWGYPVIPSDWLNPDINLQQMVNGSTVFMNPPFSMATQFVEKSFELGAHKIVCFQRFAWLESKTRQDFWQKYPPNRVYICADRADCWRHDIPAEGRGSSSPTAHAWFVWEKRHPPGTLLGHIRKSDAK